MRTELLTIERTDEKPEIEVYLDDNRDYPGLRPEANLRMSAGGVMAWRNMNPDELLALAKAAMEARAQHIATLEAWGVAQAADGIWRFRSWQGLGVS